MIDTAAQHDKAVFELSEGSGLRKSSPCKEYGEGSSGCSFLRPL